MTLTREEADVIAFLAESFVDDNKGDRVALGTAKREAYARKVLKRLSVFLDIETRCGVTGIEDSSGDRPRCTRLPHADPVHRALDIHTMRPLTWEGDRGDEYIAGLLAPAENSGAKVTRPKRSSP